MVIFQQTMFNIVYLLVGIQGIPHAFGSKPHFIFERSAGMKLSFQHFRIAASHGEALVGLGELRLTMIYGRYNYRMGPPSDVCWFINQYNLHELVRYIYYKP